MRVLQSSNQAYQQPAPQAVNAPLVSTKVLVDAQDLVNEVCALCDPRVRSSVFPCYDFFSFFKLCRCSSILNTRCTTTGSQQAYDRWGVY